MTDDRSCRASEEDRERVVGVLREQMVAGRLSSEELDEGAGGAYSAKTWDDLRSLVRDLPVTVRFADERVPVAPPRVVRLSPRPRRPSMLLPIAVVWLALMIIGDRIVFLAPILVLAMSIGIVVVCTRRW